MSCGKPPLWCFVVFAVVSAASAACLASALSLAAQKSSPPAQDQKISPEAARQIGELAREKRSRTPAQKKIDSQLLYALKQRRGETRGVPSAPIDIKLDSAGRALVDISAKVSARLISKLEKAGAEVVSRSVKYHTVRARLALEKLEAVAEIEEVRYISPAAEAMTHGGVRR